MRFSIELSSVPRGMNTEPGTAPCSNSSASRTSSTMAPSSVHMRSASAVSTSRIRVLVAASSSRKLAMTTPGQMTEGQATENPSELVNNHPRAGIPTPYDSRWAAPSDSAAGELSVQVRDQLLHPLPVTAILPRGRDRIRHDRLPAVPHGTRPSGWDARGPTGRRARCPACAAVMSPQGIVSGDFVSTTGGSTMPVSSIQNSPLPRAKNPAARYRFHHVLVDLGPEVVALLHGRPVRRT